MAQEQPVEVGQITLMPGETYEWVLDLSINTAKANSCPSQGTALALHPVGDAVQWGCKEITNGGAKPAVWRVDFGKTGGEGITLILEQGRKESVILNAPMNRTMRMVKAGGPWLASLPIALAPGETVTLWTQLSPNTMLRVDPFLGWAHLVPEEDYTKGITERGLAIAAILAASFLLILFFATFARLLNSKPTRDYALYFGFATAAFIAAEAYVAWLLPNLPVRFASWPARLFEIALFVFYYRFVASFVHTALGPHPVTRAFWPMVLAVLAVFGVTAVLHAAGTSLLTGNADLSGPTFAFAEWGAFRSEFFGIFVAGCLTTAYAGWAVLALLWARANGAVLFTLGAAVIGALFFLPYVQEFLGFDPNRSFLVLRGMFVGDGLIFAAALIRQTFGLRAERDTALQAELTASKEKLALAENLLDAKQGRMKAEALAERHRERLALTSHDLRQPLTSLRLAVSEADRVAPELGDKLSSAIDYLRQVLDDTVVDARPQEMETPDSGPVLEPVPLSILLQNVERMFGDEARGKGLEFAVQSSDAIVVTQPIALIRCVSNLVSNAVKYTETGRIDIAVNHIDERMSISVKDTGPGLTQAEQDEILQSYNRGQATDATGEGLGLTSVQHLGETLGLDLDIQSTKGRGSTFSLIGLRLAASNE